MRILGIGPRAYLGDIYLSLAREGHEVRVHAQDEPNRAFRGLLDTVPDWRAELDWVGRDGVVMFERVEQGALQDALRAEGRRVVGTSAFGERLETDRAFGQALLAECGLPVAESRGFDTPAGAHAWLRAHPGRVVLKHDDVHRTTFVGDHPQGLDVLWLLERHPDAGRVLLMEHLDGVEVGIGAYFDGHRFLRPACIDFEHKRFFPGEMGEMTGEMGTLASYEGAEPLFDATLGRTAAALRRAGHVGYVNLNLVVDRHGPRPLEFTCRFGNPGFAVLAALQPDGWGDLLARTAFQGGDFRATPGFSVAIVLTIPPFPGTRPDAAPEDDPPVFLLNQPDPRHLHWVDIRAEGPQLLAHRRSGHLGITTGTGPTVAEARHAAIHTARQVIAPDLRYRTDIGTRFETHDARRLREAGWYG